VALRIDLEEFVNRTHLKNPTAKQVLVKEVAFQ